MTKDEWYNDLNEFCIVINDKYNDINDSYKDDSNDSYEEDLYSEVNEVKDNVNSQVNAKIDINMAEQVGTIHDSCCETFSLANGVRSITVSFNGIYKTNKAYEIVNGAINVKFSELVNDTTNEVVNEIYETNKANETVNVKDKEFPNKNIKVKGKRGRLYKLVKK